ncbi:GtrA family protein [Streptomyces sp. NPDC050704]|uniref:GtrA family protein n=1 Tax=Streptomyces sp. NPDC050704 TaxID=3157219 RepID=UPI003415CA7E
MKTLLSSKPETAVVVRGGGPLASFVRFVVCGGGIGVLSSGAVVALAGVLPWVVANAVITVVSTVLCTELHARFTFGTGRRAGWRQHWQSAGSATGAYAVTSAAVLVLHLVRSSPGVLTEQVVYLGAAGVAGIGRFLVLRLFVFAGERERTVPVAVPGSAPVGVLGVTVTPVSYRSAPALGRVPGAGWGGLRSGAVLVGCR